MDHKNRLDSLLDRNKLIIDQELSSSFLHRKLLNRFVVFLGGALAPFCLYPITIDFQCQRKTETTKEFVRKSKKNIAKIIAK